MLISRERAEEVARMHYADIYYFCRSRLKSEIDSEDVAQDVFLFFQENCEELEDDKIKSWLFSVANFKIKEQFKKIARREKELILDKFLGDVRDGERFFSKIENQVFTSEKDVMEEKEEVLSALTQKELELYEKLYVKRMEYKEIAKELDITESNMRVRISRLRAKISEKTLYSFMAILLLVMRL